MIVVELRKGGRLCYVGEVGRAAQRLSVGKEFLLKLCEMKLDSGSAMVRSRTGSDGEYSLDFYVPNVGRAESCQ